MLMRHHRRTRAQACRRERRGLSLVAAAAALRTLAPAAAVLPPTTTGTNVAVELVPNGPEQVVRDTVRAYQPVPVELCGAGG